MMLNGLFRLVSSLYYLKCTVIVMVFGSVHTSFHRVTLWCSKRSKTTTTGALLLPKLATILANDQPLLVTDKPGEGSEKAAAHV